MNTLYAFSLFTLGFSFGYFDIAFFGIGSTTIDDDGKFLDEKSGSFIRITYSAEDGFEFDAFWADLWQK